MAWLRETFLPFAKVVACINQHRWRGVRFLCYHSICTAEQLELLATRTLVLSTDAFARHLAVIRGHGYAVVSMSEALHLLSTKNAALGQFICFTFDDGRVDNFEIAWPMLRSAGYVAHFFVSSSLLGKTFERHVGNRRFTESYLGREQLRAIVRDGGSIGSHAHEHIDLTEVESIRLHRELVTSREVLEEATSNRVTTHAYPYAAYNRRVVAAARRAGYLHAFGINSGTVCSLQRDGGTHDCLTIPRNVMRSGVDPGENYTILRGGLDFARTYSTIKSWLTH